MNLEKLKEIYGLIEGFESDDTAGDLYDRLVIIELHVLKEIEKIAFSVKPSYHHDNVKLPKKDEKSHILDSMRYSLPGYHWGYVFAKKELKRCWNCNMDLDT